MKNIYLFLVLIALVGAIYLFEELGEREKEKIREGQSVLFDTEVLGSLVGLKTKKFHIQKSAKNFVILPSKMRVDQKRFKKFLEVLAAIKSKRVLTAAEITALSKEETFKATSSQLTFLLENGEVTFILGSKLPLDEGFYLKVIQEKEEKWVIAYDSTPMKGMYDPIERRKSKVRYNRLKTFLDLPEDIFQDTALFGDRFYFEKDLGWKYIKFSNNRNKPFGLLIDQKKTEPAILNGAAYLENSFTEMNKTFLNIRAGRVITKFDQNKLTKPVAAIFLQDYNDLNEELKLYRQFNSRAGYFVTRKGQSQLYELDPDQGKIFFFNVQDFWDKRIAFESSKLSFVFTGKNSKSWKLIKSEDKTFEVNGADPDNKSAPSNIQFKKLFDFMNGPAEYISTWENADKKLLEGLLFTLSFSNMAIDVILESGEIILLNKKNALKLHYPYNGLPPFGIQLKDYFLNE